MPFLKRKEDWSSEVFADLSQMLTSESIIKYALLKEGFKMEITEAQLFIINNIIASLANAFSNILTQPESQP